MDKFTNLEETISFWARNDYLIINNLLCGYMDEVWKCAEIAIKDNKGILKEYDDGVREIRGEHDIKWINALKSRLFDDLGDNEKKKKILEVAKNDIANILNAMRPVKNKIVLYRTVWHGRKEAADVLSHNINDIVVFNNISSTSVTPYREDEGHHEFYRYEITLPENALALELDQFPSVRNEKGEVLLPPMKCKLTNIRNSDNEKCRGIFEFEYIEKLPVNI